ncbi:unnamed protein product [Triticum aestivum]|uniref:Uncharacterized protein n=1 Tax=Triticum aestivum TaxID=4565 RepID=A0A7H4LBN8_WHEAT|nr:unnamed protein product [Triticum aestivum]
MDASSTLRKRSLSVRTRSNGAESAVEGRTADDGESLGEPVSPSARLVEEYFIVVVIGLGAPIKQSSGRAGIGAKIACYPRFQSIQATDKDGTLRWVRTTVDLDYHIIFPMLDTAAVLVNPDQAVEDYVASLSTKPMDHSRPMWEFHILDFPTSEATATAVMRVHHSLSDGTSLLMLLLSSTRSAADPSKPPALPPLPARTSAIYLRPRPPMSAGSLAFALWLWSFVLLAWHTMWDAAIFISTILFLKDTQTLFSCTDHGNRRPNRIVHRSLSLDDVKFVKDAMNCTVNDVLVGCTDAALSRYYYRKSGDNKTGKEIRLRSVLVVNLRATTALHECVSMIQSAKGSDVKWGNQLGFIILPVHIAMHHDPLSFIRKAKNTVDRKKSSLEVAFTHVAAEVIHKILGRKAGAYIVDRMFSNTTTLLSNMIGPVEQVEFCGHPVVFIAPSQYGLQQAINVNFNSYVNTVRVVLAVDETQFPDCHELLDDFVESLRSIKDAAEKHGSHDMKA